MVGDHVAREADPTRPGAIAEVGVGGIATKVRGDPVIVERVGARDGVLVAAHPLDPLARDGALPQADEPQAGDAPAGERVELLVGDGVEHPDVAAVATR